MGVLTRDQIDGFWRDGYLVAQGGATESQLAALNAQLDAWIEESRAHAANYGETVDGKARFDLEPDGGGGGTRLRRVSNPAEISDAFRDAVVNAPLVDMVADLIGPNLKFHNCKLNMKLPGGSTRVGWHQDHPYDPHTNDDVVVALLALSDMTEENGCIMEVPGSHRERHSLYQGDTYTGEIAPEEISALERSAVPLTARAGDVCFHHTWAVHGSGVNRAGYPRNLLIASYTAADAVRLTPPAVASSMCGMIVRGEATRVARLKQAVLELPTAYEDDSFFGLQSRAGPAT